uniref:Uncharacterized protein n=1 Tax=Oncorhynchus mykiss TaxID=8022 RepID=A0A8C7NYR8_ONCMY
QLHFLCTYRNENVKDYYQKWMEEKAQSLIDKTGRRMPSNRGKIPPSPFTGSLVRYVFIGEPPHPGMLPVPGPHMNGHGPPMMQMRGPSPHGMMPGSEIVAPTLKLYIMCPHRPMMLIRPGMIQPDR